MSRGRPSHLPVAMLPVSKTEATVVDTVVESRVASALADFGKEQESSLRTERNSIEEKTKALESDIGEMKVMQAQLTVKLATLDDLLNREQSLSDEFADKAARNKEAIEAATHYLVNLRDRLATSEAARLEVLDQQRMRHKEAAEEVRRLAVQSRALREALDEAVEERDDLAAKWQAKMEIQRQSDVESKAS